MADLSPTEQVRVLFGAEPRKNVLLDLRLLAEKHAEELEQLRKENQELRQFREHVTPFLEVLKQQGILV